MHEWVFGIFLGIIDKGWAKAHLIPTIPHQIPEAHKVFLLFQSTVNIPVFQWRPVRVEYPPRALSYIHSQLHNGLSLELAVLRE